MRLRGRSVDQWGRVSLDPEGVIDLWMRDEDVDPETMVSGGPLVDRYNELCRELDHPQDQLTGAQDPEISPDEWHQALQSRWLIPDVYLNLDLLTMLVEMCSTDQQRERVAMEWSLYQERGLLPVLNLLVFLIQELRQRGILWGVGRGSSVASYILFLIGVHRVNSLEFDLDVREFLK